MVPLSTLNNHHGILQLFGKDDVDNKMSRISQEKTSNKRNLVYFPFCISPHLNA